jgi:plastocyanin
MRFWTAEGVNMFYLQGRALGLASAIVAVAGFATSGVAAQAQTVRVSLSLAKYADVRHIAAGDYAGVSPGVVRVHVGDQIVFVNDDVKVHTATSLPGSGVFPEDPHWTDDVLRATGSIGHGMWSTGELKAGTSSAPIVARETGTYLYGCFFDYSAGMRGEIIVEP